MIYLDYNSTTPVDNKVLQSMLPYFTEDFGNAASKSHAFGWKAEEAVKIARERVAGFINASESEIVFTSGATEAINLAIKGVAEAYATKGKHIVTCSTEHKAVLDCCTHLENRGYEITRLPVLSDGVIDLNELSKAIRHDTILVCIMLANNETGVIHPVSEIGKIVHEKGAVFFTDATQACGKIRVDVGELNADLLCISAHKIYGPKGTGALYVRRKNPRVTLVAQIDGGGHERNLRSGTLNVPGIVGFGMACELASQIYWDESAKQSILRTRLEQGLADAGGVTINGSIRNRIPNTTNLCFQGHNAQTLINEAREIAVATGSACSSALPEPSHVLMAMGLSEKDAYASIRFSLGKFTTEEEIEQTIEIFSKLIGK